MKRPLDVYGDLQKTPIKKINARIEIVGSSNPRLNAMTAESQMHLKTALLKQYTYVSITNIGDLSDMERLVAKKPDLVVLGMKLVRLDPTESRDDSYKTWSTTNYFIDRGIKFTGSDTTALTLEFDKHKAKQKVLDAGLQTSKYFVSEVNDPTLEHELAFPMFVKPTNCGDSRGIDEKSIVHTKEDLEAKILSIHKDFRSDVLVEEYLPGREFSVAVIRQSESHILTAMPIEITAPADEQGNMFLSEKVKQADTEKVIAISEPTLRAELNSLAIGVFNALGSKDYARIDMRINAKGQPSFIEANLMPGLSDHGYLARCFELNARISYEDMILMVIGLGFENRQPAATHPNAISTSDSVTRGVLL